MPPRMGNSDTLQDDILPAATKEYGRSPTLIRAVPSRYPFPLTRTLRFLAWSSALVVPSLFYIGPLMLAAPPFLYLLSPRAALVLLIVDIILAFYPIPQWPFFRSYFQLWYSLFDFHHNMSLPADSSVSKVEDKSLLMYATHPHGVIPIHGYLWCAFCDQHFPNRYGFGALTDVALRLPFLRQVMRWLSSEPARKDILMPKMEEGTNLYILPGGVAEIFLAQPGRHFIKAKRRGMIKLALQTGALIVPTYVFGASDFYSQLATYGNTSDGKQSIVGNILLKLSRTFKGGITFFWGQYGLPMPYEVKCSMVLADPLEPVPGTLGHGKTKSGDKMTCKKIPQPTEEQIDELMDRYIDALVRLFEQYKVQAGHPDAELEIQ